MVYSEQETKAPLENWYTKKAVVSHMQELHESNHGGFHNQRNAIFMKP